MDDASTRNNDCYFYYYSSCNKGEACSFRHEPAAMGNEEVCSLWKEGRCFRRVCSYRHMDINVDRRNTACYWESQPGGCQKPHCPFMHQNSTSLHQDGQDNYASRFVSPTIQSSNQPHTFNTQLTPSDKTLTSHERFSGGQGQFISPPSLHGFVGPCQATDRATLLPTPVDYKAGGDSQKSFNPDNIRAIPYVETIAAPQAEKIIITPCEEESDADSINGSPRKALLGTRKDTDCKSQNSSNLQQGGGDMDFKVKSLDELKKEKVRILEELQKEQKKHPDRSGHHKKSSQPEKKSLSVPAKPATHHGRPTKHDVPMKRVHITSTGDDAPSDPKHKVIKLNTGTRTKPSKPAEAVEKSDEKLVIKSLEEIQREKALKSMRDNMARKAMEARVNRDKRNQSDSIASSVDGEIKPSEQSFPQDAPQRNIVISTDAEFRRDLASRLGKQLTDIDEKTQVFDEDDVCDSGADSKGKQGETTGEFAGPTSEVKVVVCEPKAKKIKLKKHPKDAAVKEHGNRVRVVARETDTDTVVSVKPKIIRLLGKSKSETEDRKGKKKQIKHGDKRTAIELYKPPGIARQVETAKKPLVVKLKPQFSENEESTLSIGNSSSKKKDWGVKTFSEILHEKRLRRTKNTEMDTDSSESNSQETTSERESCELKPPKQLVSPVNFTRDDKTSEIEKKPVAVPHKKRVIWSTRSTDADNKCKKAQKPVLSRIKFDKVESESDTSRKPIVFDLDEPKKDIPDIPNTRRLKLSVLGSVHKRLGKTKTVPPAAEVLAPTPESSLEVPVTCKKVPVTCKSGKKRSPGVRHDDSLLNSTFDLNTPTAGKKTVSKLQSKALGTEACVASPKTADVRRKSAGSSNIRSESKPRAAPPTTAISSMADDLDNLFEDELQSFLSDMNGPEASVGKASKIEVEDDDALLMEMEELLA